MAGSSESYHEPPDLLSEKTRNAHRALTSIKEELEAIDWYRQRAEATDNGELRDILLHNMREEMEHASMLLEWLRRNDTDFGPILRTYLFTTAPITEIEEKSEKSQGGMGSESEPGGNDPVSATAAQRPKLTIGTMKQG